jgi:hypothetical protein
VTEPEPSAAVRAETWADLASLAADRATDSGRPSIVIAVPGERRFVCLFDVVTRDGRRHVELVAALPLEGEDAPA